ncbi:uncharacterized protein SPPG_06280 [Spizellomyces punctatus DAOM BR117]|uniref:MRN complex-interacting protein N-terminal domain-containing protein n=1 Tax=Spizellomyces punctatus (strain DAOM BR117) TaxID=645134 RepID=A0A0L0HCE6_SPIPD|nr:uncharacterized protein SPPG_06280 [Spizellomyces punctatus DAOM BR117]KNC98596.1 hypothetical protein SPPG_06280 [Spizellomyces punctatus DAOM BR117]|eukprot:XP_016606636.1 hypothetical protein SPPG_06280 [Spizellomyces punctatus DAOM BR117]
MPLYQVIQCYADACKMFQVQQAKKVQKWTCAVCGAKQGLKHVFFESTAGSDCRKAVQELNMRRVAREQKIQQQEVEGAWERHSDQQEGYGCGTYERRGCLKQKPQSPQKKWSLYLDSDEVANDAEDFVDRKVKEKTSHGRKRKSVNDAYDTLAMESVPRMHHAKSDATSEDLTPKSTFSIAPWKSRAFSKLGRSSEQLHRNPIDGMKECNAAPRTSIPVLQADRSLRPESQPSTNTPPISTSTLRQPITHIPLQPNRFSQSSAAKPSKPYTPPIKSAWSAFVDENEEDDDDFADSDDLESVTQVQQLVEPVPASVTRSVEVPCSGQTTFSAGTRLFTLSKRARQR